MARRGVPPWSRRRFLQASGIGAAALVAAACGGNTGRGGGAAGTLTQWYHQYGEDGVEEAVKRYAAAYDKAEVSVQWTPGNYDTKLLSALQGSAPPDVFEYQTKADLVRAGQLEPLDDIIKDVKDDFSAASLASHTFEGSVYGIPQAVDTQVLVYRKSLLDDAGLEPPKTFEALVDAAEALTKGDRKGLFLGNNGGADVLGPVPLFSAGLGYVTDDHKVGFDDPAAAKAFGGLHTLFESDALLLGAPTDWSDPSALLQELTAMQWTGLWALPQIEAEFGDDFGVLPWPKLTDDGAASVPVGAFGAMVYAKGEQADAARDFVKWLWIDKTDYQEDFNLGYGFHIPPRTTIAAKADKLSSGPAADVVGFVEELGRPSTPPEWTPAMDSAYKDALSNIIKSGKKPETELKTAAETVQRELDKLFG
ncbi:multiple sugar transport system substrate-binding protein [Murinocardiopsis flavida]|uniref:Multiple sugar transport system substrate-binding protein n=1 Tax=Murinocardiopsis flavida TaxID=645275 RepID=A0A2P8CPK0_9ACTN|nr:extracellular solute-binding protein [Murinocardiopsis flavida]PSK86896.1 multiple sugar transport system substrate-binding protein [Murinocardiopsis flavida]